MSDAHAFDFGKFIPGFDFLQKLATQRPASGGAASALGGWVAPTVSVDELDRRIKELKAVQFWLEQNTTAIKATVQALEVQKMTLATLQGMNLSMAEVAKAFTLPTQESAASPAAAPAERASGQWPYSATPAAPATPEAPVAAPEPAPAQDAAEAAAPPEPAPASPAAEPPAAPPAAGMADPMAWWSALTQQFQQIASSAMREAVHAMPDAVNAFATAGAPAAKPAARKAAKKAPARQATAGKSAAAKSTRKKVHQPAARSAAKPAAKPATKSAARSAARPARPPAAQSAPQRASTKAKAKAETPRAGSGWPLPPPFKLGR